MALALARVAAERGARRFVLVTSVAAAVRSPNFYLRVKAELERDAAVLPFETAVFLRPSFLIGKRREFRLGERIGVPLTRAVKPLLFGPMRMFRAISADTVAAAMIGAALHAPPGRDILHYDEMLHYARQSEAR